MPPADQDELAIHVFPTVASTNRTLWELIDQGAAPGTVAIALQQDAGKGQWGRQWQSPPGGMYLSLALAPHVPVAQAGQLTLCSAWGIATALRQQHLPVGLKWPNDLVAHGRKLGGMLIETRLQQGHISWAIIGMGINWINPVPSTGITVQALAAEQAQPAIASLEQLIGLTLGGIMAAYDQWRTQGLEAILPAYEALLVNLGQPVIAQQQPGQVAGVTPSGALRVRLDATATEIELPPGSISLGYGSAP